MSENCSGLKAQGWGKNSSGLRAEGSGRAPSPEPRAAQHPSPKPRTLSSQNGFTFPEVVIVMMIFLIVGAGLLVALLSGRTSYLSSDAYIQVQYESRRAFDAMVRELRQAGNVAVNAGQLDFQIALGYNLAAPCPANQVCWGAVDETGANQPNWSVRYRVATSVNGTQLLREVYNVTPPAGTPQSSRVLSNSVNAATTSFVWDSVNRTVTITLENRYTNTALPGGAQTTGPLISTVRVRNS